MYDRPAAVELAFPRWHCCCWRANAHWRTVVWRGRRRRGEGGGRPLVYVRSTYFVRGTTLCPFSACIWSGIEQEERSARGIDSSEHTVRLPILLLLLRHDGGASLKYVHSSVQQPLYTTNTTIRLSDRIGRPLCCCCYDDNTTDRGRWRWGRLGRGWAGYMCLAKTLTTSLLLLQTLDRAAAGGKRCGNSGLT